MDRFECLFCRKSYPHDPFSPFCPGCHEPLFIAPRSGRKKTVHPEEPHPLKKYFDFLPLDDFDPRLSLGEGDTPLLPLERLGRSLPGIPRLFAKNEAQNPTGSFKDRGTALAIQKALSLGFRKVGTVSTGNMAASTAAYGARAGVPATVLLKEGTSSTSLRAAGIFGPDLVAVKGDYGRLFYDSLALGRELGIYFMNSIEAFRVEGYKVTGFEVFDQLGGRVPGHVVVPLSSGGHLIGLMRAFEDLEREGLADRYPTFVGVQASGCAPLARAFEKRLLRYERLDRAETIAHAISNPAPPGGNAALKMIADHKGVILSVSDAEMLEAQRDLASSEGLFCQPESAATLAGLRRLAARADLPPDEPVVLILTGSGLKTPHVLESQSIAVRESSLEGLAEALRERS